MYGERRSETFFEFFVENRVMGLLVFARAARFFWFGERESGLRPRDARRLCSILSH